jgi:putative membrane protein
VEPSIRDHLANERTLLAWIRTAVTVIGLGLLVDRLAVERVETSWEAFAGVGLVLFGVFLAGSGAYSYLNARREMTSGSYRSQVTLHLVAIGIVAVGGVVIAALLILG